MKLFEGEQELIDAAKKHLTNVRSNRQLERELKDRRLRAKERDIARKELEAKTAAQREARKGRYYELHKSQVEKAARDAGTITTSDTDATATGKMISPIGDIAKSAVKGIASGARNIALSNPRYRAIDTKARALMRLGRMYDRNNGKSPYPKPSQSTTTPTTPTTSQQTTSTVASPTPTTSTTGSQLGPKPLRPLGSKGPKPLRSLGPKGPNSNKKPSGSQSSMTEEYEYSCWREEFIYELRDLRQKARAKNDDGDKKIDVMRGQNKVIINPTVSNEEYEYSDIYETTNGASIFAKATPPLKRRTTPMSDVYLSKQPGRGTAEQVKKEMIKLFLGNRKGYTTNYDLSLKPSAQNRVNEAYDENDETFRQHSKEMFTAGPGDATRRKRTSNALKAIAAMNKDVVSPKKKKKKKKKED